MKRPVSPGKKPPLLFLMLEEGDQVTAELYPATRLETGVENCRNNPVPARCAPQARVPGEEGVMRMVEAGS